MDPLSVVPLAGVRCAVGMISGAPLLATSTPGDTPRPARRFPPPHWLDIVEEHVAAAGESPPSGRKCRCGHGKKAHTHYRRGTDCSLCGCERYSRPLSMRLGLRRGR